MSAYEIFKKIREIQKKSGLTLIELTISIAIAVIIIGITTLSLKSYLDLWSKGKSISEANDDVRLALEWLTRELHDAKYLDYANTTRIDITTGNDKKKVRYYLNATTFKRMALSEPASEEPLVNNVSYLNFTFRNSLNITSPAPEAYPQTGMDPSKMADIRLINVDLKTASQNNLYSFRTSIKTDFVTKPRHVKNPDLNPAGYYGLFTEALADPGLISGHNLLSTVGTSTENFSVSKTIKFSGGYDESFSFRNSGNFTLINGTLTFTNGTSEIEWFIIQ